MAWLADLQQTVYPHKWSPVSRRSSAKQDKFAGQRPTFCHCATLPTSVCSAKRAVTLEQTVVSDVLSIKLSSAGRPVVRLTGRRHLRSAASGKLYVQRTATAIGRRNFAVSGPETWNSLPAELRLSTLSTATFTRRLKAHLFVSTE